MVTDYAVSATIMYLYWTKNKTIQHSHMFYEARSWI